MNKEFRNEPFANFRDAGDIRKMQEALAKVRADFGREYPMVIAGEKIFTKDKIRSINPASPTEVVGVTQVATALQAEQAIAAAADAFESWKKVPANERADYLFRAAAAMRKKKFELAAVMVYEVGKSWAEADGDVCEAIDFCDYYAAEALRYGEGGTCLNWPGENDTLSYVPLGVGVVIPPWNFPLAILTGMTVASWVAGNTVVLKPSSDSTVIAAKFMELMEEIGLPKGVVNFVTGGGGKIGDTLVSDAKTRFISFTGSKAVGLHINELAAKQQKGQKWIKRVIAEMGGKDAIIVDSNADVSAAATGVVSSAFGFQGQKCSACSRAIVVADVYDEFVRQIVEKAKALSVGPTEDHQNFMGPVVNKKAFESILGYIEIGKKEGKMVLEQASRGGDKDGYFISPTIFIDVEPEARIAQEEIFGPVLAVIKARDFDHAIKIANGTDYGLTGAVYTKDGAKIEKAKKEFFVGNLYINRKCTGAMVACHPFGGYNMSGTCSKAGGPDYLHHFMQSKSIAEAVAKGPDGRP